MVVEPSTANDPVRYWIGEIARNERDSQEWKKRARSIIKRYQDKRTDRDDRSSRFNILWSNVQTLMPALWFQNPKPNVSRRHNDADPVGRIAADALERSVSYFIDGDDFGQSMRQSVLDYLLVGRGVAWVRYVPHFRDAAVTGPEEVRGEGAQITDDAEIETSEGAQPIGPTEEVSFEEVIVDYVHWDDFGYSKARTWQEVRGVWRVAFVDFDELCERFGREVALTVPLDHRQKDAAGRTMDDGAKASIYEVWDKSRKEVIWLHRSMKEPLDRRPDPLQLEGFFPCPRPLFTNLANDDLTPVPDFIQYQDQAIQLDDLTGRIASMTKSLKVVGVRDASAEGLDKMLAGGMENVLVPVDQWAIHAEKGGLKGVMEILPIDMIAKTLLAVYEARDKVKAEIYEITGIADIIRGATAPSETATAQQIKGQFATLRLSDRQKEVQRYGRDVIRIIGQIVASHFGIDTIKAISGLRLLTDAEKNLFGMGAVPLPKDMRPDELEDLMRQPSWEQVGALLKDEPARSFRLDIETDSTVKADQETEKKQRVEFLQAAGGFLQQAVQAGQQQPEMIPLLAQMLMFGVRAFPVGKELEQSFDAALAKMEKAAANPQPKPDPEAAKMQAQQASEQARMQADMQIEQFKAQNEAALAEKRLIAESQIKQAQMQSEMQIKQMEAEASVQVERHKQEAQQAQFEAQSQIEIAKADAEAQRSIEVERVKFQMKSEFDALARQMDNEAAFAIAKLKAETDVIIAQINATAKSSPAPVGMPGAEAEGVEGVEDIDDAPAAPDPSMAVAAALEAFTQAIGSLSRPRMVVRDESGKIIGVQ